MPLIPNGEALDEFFDPQGKRYRRDKTSFRVGLAISVAELVAEVHRHHLEITLGDLKPRNILADDMGRVALVDLDSVQLTTLRGATYLCPVASEYYKAPEVYRMDLRRQRREPSSDLFALAVIVFQLLLGGWHPFAAAGDLDLVGRIRRGEFPHVAGFPDRPPPGAPPFSALPVELQHLFIQAFVDGNWNPGGRPTADVFVEALKRNAKALAHPNAVAPAAAKAPTAAGRLWRVLRRGVAAVAAVAIVAPTLGFFGARWLHGEARARSSRAPRGGTREVPLPTNSETRRATRRRAPGLPATGGASGTGATGGLASRLQMEPIRGDSHEHEKPSHRSCQCHR